MGAVRFGILPIHLLRQLGYEAADKTAHCRGGSSPWDFADTSFASARLRGCRRNRHCHGGNSPWDFADTSFASARLRSCRQNRHCLATRECVLGRQSVTVTTHLNPLPLLVALSPQRQLPCAKGGGSASAEPEGLFVGGCCALTGSGAHMGFAGRIVTVIT